MENLGTLTLHGRLDIEFRKGLHKIRDTTVAKLCKNCDSNVHVIR